MTRLDDIVIGTALSSIGQKNIKREIKSLIIELIEDYSPTKPVEYDTTLRIVDLVREIENL